MLQDPSALSWLVLAMLRFSSAMNQGFAEVQRLAFSIFFVCLFLFLF